MWVVCQFKDDGEMFINSRKARESMVNTLLELNQPIESIVLKEFETYAEADEYKKQIIAVDEQIKKTLN